MLSISEFFIYQNLAAEITIFDGYISKIDCTFPIINQNIPYLNPCYRNDVRLFTITFGPTFGDLPIRSYRVWGLFSFTRWFVIFKRVCWSYGGWGSGVGLEIKWRGFFSRVGKIHVGESSFTIAEDRVQWTWAPWWTRSSSWTFPVSLYPGATVWPPSQRFCTSCPVTNDTGDSGGDGLWAHSKRHSACLLGEAPQWPGAGVPPKSLPLGRASYLGNEER